jgi:hypothetical protein
MSSPGKRTPNESWQPTPGLRLLVLQSLLARRGCTLRWATLRAMKFSFGQAEEERIEVDVHSCENLQPGAKWYDNWLSVDIRIQAGGFQGQVSAQLISDELVRFASQLRPLYQSLTGVAELSTMEGQLSLRLVGDGKGHIGLSGEVRDRPDGNRLQFTLAFDQSELRASIRELERVTSQFPSRVA